MTRGGADLDAIKGDATADEKKPEPAAAGIDNLIALMKLALKDAVKDVRVSQRLTDSAVCLVADDGDMDMRLARLLQQHKRIDALRPARAGDQRQPPGDRRASPRRSRAAKATPSPTPRGCCSTRPASRKAKR